jgi:hypothetical protein
LVALATIEAVMKLKTAIETLATVLAWLMFA